MIRKHPIGFWVTAVVPNEVLHQGVPCGLLVAPLNLSQTSTITGWLASSWSEPFMRIGTRPTIDCEQFLIPVGAVLSARLEPVYEVPKESDKETP